MKSIAGHQSKSDVVATQDTVLRSFLGYALKRAYLSVRPAAAAGMARNDLKVTSFTCLSLIVENPCIAPSTLAEYLKMGRSNIVVIIDDLESRDLINRKRSDSDRRRFELTATVRGRRIHDQTVTEIRRQEGRLLAALTDEETALLVALLDKVEGTSAE